MKYKYLNLNKFISTATSYPEPIRAPTFLLAARRTGLVLVTAVTGLVNDDSCKAGLGTNRMVFDSPKGVNCPAHMALDKPRGM